MLVRIFLITWLCLQIKISSAQGYEEQYTVRHYTDENGLPQNSVKSISPDRDGFIWLATENGLVRFDGQHFFTFDKTNSDLKSSRFYSLLPDLSGNPNRLYAIGDNLDDVLRIEKANTVKDITYYSKQVSRIPHSNTEHDRIAAGLPNNLIPVSETVLQYYIIMVPGRTGTYYMIHRNRVEFFTNWKKQWERPNQSDFKNYVCINGDLFCFDASGDLLPLKADKTDKIRIVGDILKDPAYIPGSATNTIYWNHLSGQVFIKVNNNFYYLDNSSKNSWNARLILDGFNFQGNSILTAYYDNQNSRLFLGSSTRGLYVFKRKEFNTLRFGNTDPENIFYAQTAYKDNSVLTPKGYILGEDETKEKKRKTFKGKLPLIETGYDVDGNSILKDRKGNIWSKSGYNLYQYNADGTKLLHSWNMNDQVYTLSMGENGRIWLGMNLKELYYIDPSDPDPTPMPFKNVRVKDIFYILQGHDNKLWLVTHKGLFCVDIKTRKTVHISGTEKLNIRSLFVPALHAPGESESLNKGIFLTTMGDGILFYTGKKLIKLPLDDNKYLAAAHYMVEDKKGFLWVPTNKGLFQFAKRDLLTYVQQADNGQKQPEKPFFLYYNKENGFNSNEFNGGCQPCGIRLPNGQVSLSSMDGLVWFTPEKVIQELPGRNFFIDQLEADGNIQQLNRDTVNFHQDPNQISFHLTIPNYGNTASVRFSYALTADGDEPLETDWIAIKTSDPTIRFSRLASGEYLLTVKKQNGFGNNNDTVRRLLLIVPGHWYETWLFRILCAVIFAGAVYSINAFRIYYLRKKNQELETKIKTRTRQLEEALIEQQKSEKELNRQMHMRTRLVASISHDIRTPVSFLFSAAERIEPMIALQKYDQASAIGKNIAISAKQIKQLLENMINYIKTQYKEEHIRFSEVMLSALIAEKINLFAPVILEQGNVFKNEIRSDVSVFSNMNLLAIVIHNIIDNANKFTSRGQVRVFTERKLDKLHLIIADTGPGIPGRLMHWLNDEELKDASDRDPDISQEFNGLGLLMIKELTSMLGINILIEKKNGTYFHLIFNME